MQARREGHSLRKHLRIAHQVVGMGRHDDIGRLDDAAEAGVCFFAIQHELQATAIQLAHCQHWLDALAEGLQSPKLHKFIRLR